MINLFVYKMSLKQTLDTFFDSSNIQNTITHLINNNISDMKDVLFEIASLCLSSSLNIVLGDRGIAFFKKNYSIVLAYEALTVLQIDSLVHLMQVCSEKENYCFSEERGGSICMTILEPTHYTINHTDVLVGLHSVIMSSDIDIIYSKAHLTNILFQRIVNMIHIEKDSMREAREIISSQLTQQSKKEATLSIDI